MADPREVDNAIDYMTDIYGRQAASSRLRSAWYEEFSESDGRLLMEVVKAACRTEKFMPSLAVIAPLLAEREGTKTGTNEPPPCPNCFAMLGWREMAIQWITLDGAHHAKCILAACDCRLGQVRQAGGARPWRDVWDSWRSVRDRLVANGGHVLEGYPVKTHRDMPKLEEWHRETPENLWRYPRHPRSTSVAQIVADAKAKDPYAAPRRRTIEQDEARDDRGGEYR